MGLLRGLKEIINKFDLFDSGSLLRVKGEPEHKTLFGGALSIAIMVMLLAAFSSRIIDTLDKVLITSSSSTNNAYDPLPFNISTVDNGPFMFGFEVFNHNLNKGSRYFDVQLINIVYQYGLILNTSIQFRLQACTIDHWSSYPEVQSKFDSLAMGNWKCLPKNAIFEIKSKYSSQEAKTLSVAVKKCTNNSFESRPCAPQSQIDQYFINNPVNYFSLYFMNPLLNPNDENYLTYYFEDTNYIIFSQQYGGNGLIFVEDYSISTDNSILPTTSIQTKSGGIVTTSAIKNAYVDITQTYAEYIIFKSATSQNINRSFQKLDNVLSYIGGLFGTFIMCFFLITSYNTYKFQVNLAGYLYKAEKNQQKIQKNYNFAQFIGHSAYALLRLLNLRPNWENLKRYHETREEMLKQLDILYLIKRINFLEKLLSLLFSEQQLQAIHLTPQPTLADAAKTRRNYKLKSRLKKELQLLNQSQNIDKSSFIVQRGNKNNSIQFIDFHNVDSLKPAQDSQSASINNCHFDSDNYTSEDSSNQSEGNNFLSDINELRKDKKNQLSKQIWNKVDIRLKQMIEKSATKNYGILQQDERSFRISQPKIIEMSNVNYDPSPSEKQDQLENRLQFKSDYANVIFSNLQTVKVQNNFHLNNKDEQFEDKLKDK